MTDKTYQWTLTITPNTPRANTSGAQELIAKLNLQGSESVLDIGCGDGKVTACDRRARAQRTCCRDR